LKISAPYLDPVGTNQLWYKWTFFNDDLTCDDTRFENYCFNTAPIDGQKEPFIYSTYVKWADYYVKEEVMTFYWIVFAFSIFWVPGTFA
jgi:hypothetical protein